VLLQEKHGQVVTNWFLLHIDQMGKQIILSINSTQNYTGIAS